MQKHKKIILYLITQSEWGGAQRYVMDLVRNIHIEYKIVVAFGEQGEKGELAKFLREHEIKYYVIPHLKRAISPINDYKALQEIIKLMKKINPRIVHLNSTKASILGSLAGLFITNPLRIIYTVHGWVFNEPLIFWKKSFYRWAERITAKMKKIIICVSENDRQAALIHKIAPDNKLTTIHNGIIPPDFLPPSEARAYLLSLFTDNEFIINKKTTLIGAVGNLYATKGFEYFIKAIKILVEENMDIRALIIGEGKERADLESWITQLNLEHHIKLTGFVPQAVNYMKAFDIFVSSSVKEGLSYTIIEAMMASLPIVATRVGGSNELISDHHEGLIIEPANTDALAKAIAFYFNYPELGKEYGQKAHQKAMTEFRLENMIQKTRYIYENR